MSKNKLSFVILPILLLAVFSAVFSAGFSAGLSTTRAQQKAPQPVPSPFPSPVASPTPVDQGDTQEPVKVFTEEVRLPVVAIDQFGHYDPTLVADDILVLEDGKPQQIRSVRHVPANVLIVLDTGGETPGLGGMGKKTSLTVAVAGALIMNLHEGDSISLMQFNDKVELLQPWTNDRNALLKVLKWKVSSGKRNVFSDAVAAAAQQIQDRPEGSRHVVFITDGVDTPGAKAERAKAIKELIAARATVHIISYTEFVRQTNDKKSSGTQGGLRPRNNDPITATDPTLAPNQTRSPVYGVSIRFDPAMKRLRKAYEADVKKSQQTLSTLAQETGGTIFLPKTSDEMVDEADKVARDIGSEYVVTYRPTRPLASAAPGEYRRVEIGSRRVGLILRSRRGYVASPGKE